MTDNTSNNSKDDSARAVGSKKRTEIAEEVFNVHIKKITTHRDADYRVQDKQDNDNANVATVKPRREDICSAFDLPEQDNKPGRPFVAFSVSGKTPAAASIQIEKGVWSLDPLPNIRPAPRPWPFVERIKPIILLCEQDKPDVTNTHERANEHDIPFCDNALMASESPGVEQKSHDGGNLVRVLVDSGASGN